MSDDADVYAELDETPDPPVNARIHYMDGSEDPVELVYEGTDSAGIRHWVAVPTAPLLSVYATVKVDQLPPMTSISIRSEDPR